MSKTPFALMVVHTIVYITLFYGGTQSAFDSFVKWSKDTFGVFGFLVLLFLAVKFIEPEKK